MSFASPGLSVIVPFYNEADNVIPLIKEINEALNTIPHEILAIDDASRDGTDQKLLIASQTFSQLRVLTHDQNYGQSAGILTGARHAQFSLLATLDGDGQNDPADLIKLWHRFQNLPPSSRHSTVIFGNRERRQDNFLRRLSSRTANTFRKFMLKDLCSDTGCALKMFPRKSFLELPLFNHFHRFLPALFQRANHQIINVKVSHRPRTFGQSKYGVWNRLWVGIYDIFGVRWLMTRQCSPKVTENKFTPEEKLEPVYSSMSDESNISFAYK